MSEKRIIPAERYQERILSRIEFTADCWLWRGAIGANGYGEYSTPSRTGDLLTKMAHRIVFEWLVSAVPQGLVLDHLCRTRDCVNPEHLEPVPQRINVLRGDSHVAKQAGQTHCKRGHEFTAENTAISRQGFRRCRICRRQAWRDWRDRQRRIQGGAA